MSTIIWPSGLKAPAAVDYGVQYDVQLSVSRSGRIYTSGLPGARWLATLTFANEKEETRAALEALLLSLRGGANLLSMPHFGRPIPRGTLRGTPQVATATTAGAGSVALKNCNGTVKAGDILGIGGQLLMVTADASPSSGNMTVQVSPAIRKINAVNTPVTWDRPTCLWVPRSSLAGPFPFAPVGIRPSFSVEFVESGL